MPYVQRKRAYRKRYTRKRTPRTRYNKRNIIIASRALRIAKSVNRKVAGEVNKWQVVPSDFSNAIPGEYNNYSVQISRSYPLNAITSGTPWVMPLNWIYQVGNFTTPYYLENANIDGVAYSRISETNKLPATINSFSVRNPIWYNTIDNTIDTADFVGAELQYKIAYIYIRGIFNASVNDSTNNTDGAVRFVIVKDKQPQGGAATWYDSNAQVNSSSPASRGVFNANLIDAQLNPATTGRFKIIYDKTMRFTTINGYKPFKYFKRLNTVVRNLRRPMLVPQNPTVGQTSTQPAPVLKNAFYLMIFSDGINFTYSEDSSTPAAGFHLYSRIGYYNN